MSSINTNLQGLKLSNVLFDLTSDLNKRLRNLSSGAKVNNASDDSASMFVNSKLDSNINGLDSANHNIQIASNALSLAEGALNSIRNSLQKIRVLNLQALNSTYSDSSKNSIQNHINSLFSEIVKIQDSTKFNNKSLFVEMEKLDPNTTQILNPSTAKTKSSTKTSTLTSTSDKSAKTLTQTLTSTSDKSAETLTQTSTSLTDTTLATSDSIYNSSYSDSSRDIALTSLDTTGAEIMGNSDTISLAANESKVVKIGDLHYEITNDQAESNSFEYDYQNGKITFTQTDKGTYTGKKNITIKALDDKSYNIESNLRYSKIYGSSQNDTIKVTGSYNYSTIYGGDGDDKITTNGTHYTIYGENGNDIITSNSSVTTIYGGDGDDTITANKTQSFVHGGDGDDTISIVDNSGAYGDNGDDTITIKGANSCASGGDGNDTFIKNSSYTNTVIIGGSGTNTIEDVSKVSASDIIAQIDNKTTDSSSIEIPANSSVEVTIKGKKYTFKSNDASQASSISWVLTSEGITFGGSNVTITGQKDVEHNVTLVGNRLTFNGGDKNDKITNNAANSHINGNGGDDILINNGYRSQINSGSGNDTIYANNGAYVIRNDSGDDTIYLNGSVDNTKDRFYLGPKTSNTIYINTNGKKFTPAGSANNTFYINGDGNTVTTGSGKDNFIINGNKNTVNGGDGDDQFTIYGDENTVNGEAGDDYCTVVSGEYNTVDGGNGDDLYLDFGKHTEAKNIKKDERNVELIFTFNGEEKTIITSDKKVYTIINNAKDNNTLNYTYNPKTGEIIFIGDSFTISAADGVDHNINLNGNNNVINGSDKNDTILISNGSDNKIFGNDGNDTITSNSSNNTIYGNNGNDTIIINKENGSYEIDGGDGNDTITINANNTTNVKGSDGNDTIIIKGSNNTADGGNGDDTIDTNGDNNTINGGNGNDTITIKGSNNTADGDDGADTIGANGNDNTINVSDSNNNIYTIGDNNTINETSDNSNEITLEGNNNKANLNNGDNIINIVNSTGANVTVGDGDNNIKVIGQDNNVKTGNGNNDVTCSGSENNITTGSGNDNVNIAGNRNTVNTGDGDDLVTVNSGDGNDLDGGNGNDNLNNLGTNTKVIHFEYLKKKTNPFSLQIGPHSYDLIKLDLGFLLGNISIDVLSEENARNSLDYVDSLLKEVNRKISEIGVYQNCLAGIEDLNNITKTNLSAFKSTIMDADIAKEMFYLTKDQIRNQACVSLINVNETVNRNLIISLLSNL